METRPSRARPPPTVPWQFAGRAVAVIAGLTLLLIVEVRGVAFYVAWALIVLALLSEATATVVYWRRARRAGALRASGVLTEAELQEQER